jgi:ABC-type sugar transport system permease subunit
MDPMTVDRDQIQESGARAEAARTAKTGGWLNRLRSSAAEEPAPKAHRKTLWQRMKRYWYVYLMLVPSFGLLLLFTYYPAAVAMIESFFDWKPGIRNTFVGLYNYKRVLTDRVFWFSFRNVLIIAIWKFSLPFAIPILVAEGIFNLKSKRAKEIYRLAILIPILVPGIVNLMLWKWIYSAPDGGLNLILSAAGLGELVKPWLGTRATALPAILFMGFPWVVGTAPLIYLAGLLNISGEVIDASLIDGCSTLRRIISIDLPHLLPQVRLFLIFGIIDVIQSFGGPLALTRGGPGISTMVPGLYLYKFAFGLERDEKSYTLMGAACAVGVILFVIIFILTFFANRFTRTSGVEYEAGAS